VLTGTPWRFAGQRLDPESGLYYMRGRHYSPQLGRFVQPDPIGYEGGLNLYAYVNNDPLNFTDPMGTEPSGSKSASLLERLRPAMELASMDGGPVSAVASAVLAVMDYGKGDIVGAGLNAMELPWKSGEPFETTRRIRRPP
jgi:RHS repeat-associated protein